MDRPTAVFDPDQMLERLGYDEAMLPIVLKACLDDFPELAERLRTALEAHDDTTALYLAHSFKGAAGTSSFGRLAGVAGEIEERLAQGNRQGAAVLLAPLGEVLNQSLARAERFLATIGG